jgi:Macrocin-O-methyltransferase (TylF)
MFRSLSVIKNLVKKTLQGRKKENIIDRVIREHLTYLEREALAELVNVVISNDRNQIEGIIIEAGCALGGSAIAIAESKNKKRSLFVYDVFDMIPSPSEKDDQDVHKRYDTIVSGASQGIGEDKYYGYEENLYDKVLQSLIRLGIKPAENNVHLIKGLFEDTLHVSMPVSLAHIDCDWYESVMTCLQRIEPHLVSGGILVIDDYAAWSGCRKAVDDYFEKRRTEFDFIENKRLHIVKH